MRGKQWFPAYKETAAALQILRRPDLFRNKYTVATKNSIRVSYGGDTFRWEITGVAPEDCESVSFSRTSAESPVPKHRHGMTKYTVTIEEQISQSFQVEACDIFHAVDIAERRYIQGEFVILPSTPTARLVAAQDDETGETTAWKEF